MSQHGAQLINAMSTEGKILEVLPIPYCLEGWGQTMMRMAGYMELEYNCLLAPSDTWKNYTIKEMRNKYKEERNLAKWQSDQFRINTKFYQIELRRYFRRSWLKCEPLMIESTNRLKSADSLLLSINEVREES